MKAEYRDMLTDTQSSLRVKLFAEKEFPAAWHFHPQYELTYVLKSTGIRYIGDNIQNFGPGDFVLVGSNLPHSWKTVGLQEEEVQAVIIQWNEDLLGSGWLNKVEFQGIAKLLNIASSGIKFSDETVSVMAPRVIKMTKLFAFEKIIALLEILNELASCKNYTLLASAGFNHVITSEDSKRISLVQNFVKNNIQRNFHLTEVADLLGLTEESFCRYFKKIHNKPFFHFVNEYKIAIASKLLIETDMTVTEISFECGYNNTSFFHRQFKKMTKLNPLAYRNSYYSINLV